jgi:hypothetical protein
VGLREETTETEHRGHEYPKKDVDVDLVRTASLMMTLRQLWHAG